MAETNVTGPGRLSWPSPGISTWGAVMMNRGHLRAVDISKQGGREATGGRGSQGQLESEAFYLDSTIRPNSQKGAFVDYLDAAAMDAFISLSYQKHFDHIGASLPARRSSSHSGTSRHASRRRAYVDWLFQPGVPRRSTATRHEILPGPVV